ncbi:MAG: DUF2231 domain-containing protein [Anaerolineae bacterium]|nr:DUF2231 domain-containing protein [Anaerolineae bacterium]
MESKNKFLGHPIHQMLIVLPLGTLIFAAVLDVLHLITRRSAFAAAAFYNLAAGIVTGLVSAIFGFLDWSALPEGTRAKRIGFMHGAGNALVMVLSTISWLLRSRDKTRPPEVAQMLSLIAVSLGGVTAWLGGELVDRLGVGVDRGANLNAPNSLSGRPADAMHYVAEAESVLHRQP